MGFLHPAFRTNHPFHLGFRCIENLTLVRLICNNWQTVELPLKHETPEKRKTGYRFKKRDMEQNKFKSDSSETSLNCALVSVRQA